MDDRDTDSFGIDLRAQAVGDRTDGMLGRGVLPYARIRRLAGTRVDEDDLPLALAQLLEERAGERIWREHVRLDLFAELVFGRLLDSAEANDPGTVNEHVEGSALHRHGVDQI